MKSILLTTLLSSLISSGIEPQEKPALSPEKCPSVSFIALEKINYIAPLPTGYIWWTGVIENSRYDTNDNWTMLILTATKEKNGRKVLKEMSSNMHLLEFFNEDTPQWDDNLGATVCRYKSEEAGIGAIAIYPSLYSDVGNY